MSETRADVAIVGAALGGLVAGAILTRHGKRVVILDGADVVGGRAARSRPIAAYAGLMAARGALERGA